MTQRNISCSGTRRINIVKMTVLYKAVYRFNATPKKMAFFTELEQQQQQKSQLVWENKRP